MKLFQTHLSSGGISAVLILFFSIPLFNAANLIHQRRMFSIAAA